LGRIEVRRVMAQKPEFDFDVDGVAYTIGVLRKVDRDLIRELRKEIRKELKPTVNKIVGEINTSVTGQLQSRDYEMFHNGRTQWNGVRGFATVKSTSKQNAAQLVFTGRGGKVGFDYAELAGIERRPPRRRSKGWYSTSPGYHSYDYAGQGKVFNDRLERDFGKPGRFAWIRVIKQRKKIEREFKQVIDKFTERVSRKLR